MSKLNIIRASAGSGKTHYLTGFFLKNILGRETDYYKRILAVTFTNKATEEMKSRIVEQLNVLSTGENSDFMKLLIGSTGYTEERIRNKAGAILKNILHDYSWFSVETIDSFFQQIIRAFTRELGMPGNYKIELDTSPILEYAVDELLDSLQPNSELLSWLILFTEERIDEGKSWNIRQDLLDLGKQVFKEEFSENSDTLYNKVSDKKALKEFRDHLHAVRKSFSTQMQNFGKRGNEILIENNIVADDLFQKGRGVAGYFTKLAQGDFSDPNSYVIKMLDGPEFWAAPKSEKKHDIEQLAQSILLPLLKETLDYVENKKWDFNTANEILKNLYSVGILADLYSKVVKYRYEQNSFILSDAPNFINRIIDRNDAPFIYEKIGNRYRHFLIDEFQDTSGLQWENFRPLISNSLASGNDCLVVGDAKQSIYRWRNSNWEILAHKLFTDFPPEQLISDILPTNWRSSENIVNFNNQFFSLASSTLSKQIAARYEEEGGENNSLIDLGQGIYGDVEQQVSGSNKNTGLVKVQFVDNKELRDSPDMIDTHLLEHINELLEHDFSPGEIAIIVRNKREGRQVADLLIEKNSEDFFHQPLAVISDESLFIEASNAVNLLIAAMQFLADPENEINQGKLSYHCQVNEQLLSEGADAILTDFGMQDLIPALFTASIDELVSVPLYDLSESLLRIFSLRKVETEIPYLDAFLDLVHEYVQMNSSNIAEFLDYWESEGRMKSVPTSSSQNSVRIITIHKSKGLEFRAVIVPFCNWEFDQKSRSVFWAGIEREGFSYLPVLPLSYNKNLKDSWFAGDYFRENFKSNVDNLNLLYVAFTRAEESLMVISNLNTQKKTDGVAYVSELLYTTLAQDGSGVFNENYNAGNLQFSIGEYTAVKKLEKELKQIAIVAPQGKAITERLFFNPRGYDFYDDESTLPKNKAVRGIILHEILSHVTTAEDVNSALNKAVFDGLIDGNEKAELKEHVYIGMKDALVSAWFDGKAEILNEAEILLPGGESRRPDRVVIFPDRVEVIDYKFGKEEEIAAHKKQVEEYVKLLEQLGYKNVTGYLWYLNSNRIEKV